MLIWKTKDKIWKKKNWYIEKSVSKPVSEKEIWKDQDLDWWTSMQSQLIYGSYSSQQWALLWTSQGILISLHCVRLGGLCLWISLLFQMFVGWIKLNLIIFERYTQCVHDSNFKLTKESRNENCVWEGELNARITK